MLSLNYSKKKVIPGSSLHCSELTLYATFHKLQIFYGEELLHSSENPKCKNPRLANQEFRSYAPYLSGDLALYRDADDLTCISVDTQPGRWPFDNRDPL